MPKIPRIIHQLWIGHKTCPQKLMNTWKEKHPDYEYIFWNEEEIKRRNIVFRCEDNIQKMTEINGKADIMRWEILYEYGGIFIDADSICIEKLDDFFLENTAFAGYENEMVREGLVATGTMGFIPKHPLCRDAINHIMQTDTCPETSKKRAWQTVGPLLLTQLLANNKYNNFVIYPSYYFLPIHYSGIKYEGHSKIYAYQLWGSTHNNYDVMNNIVLPDELKKSGISVSILVSSYNTKIIHIKDCLDSIKEQTGNFSIELVWINDGSDTLHTKLLEKTLDTFKNATRFCDVKYVKMPNNVGIGECLNQGVHLCSNEMIFKMDSDDIMIPHRISTQIEFFKTNPDCMICGSNIQFFQTIQNGQKVLGSTTNHPQKITWEEYKNSQPKSHWFMNHPSICFNKTAVINAGNYNPQNGSYAEDIDLELRIMKMYGCIYNIPEVLLYYRIHEDQITNKMKNGEINYQKVEEIIGRVLEDDNTQQNTIKN